MTTRVQRRSRARVVRLADVQPERVEWLWPGRVPAGMITLLDGDPALGKSTITIDLAARVTTGAPMPLTTADDSKPGIIGDVVILTAEDHLGATVRPRLDAAGGDARRVHVLTGIARAADPDAPIVLPTDVAELETVIRDNKARLVVIDPLMAFLGADIDSYRDQDVRRALAPLAKVAAATGAAIIIVRHLRKSAGAALYRGGGSIGIIGAVGDDRHAHRGGVQGRRAPSAGGPRKGAGQVGRRDHEGGAAQAGQAPCHVGSRDLRGVRRSGLGSGRRRVPRDGQDLRARCPDQDGDLDPRGER
jgi:AAA domain-containing protein